MGDDQEKLYLCILNLLKNGTDNNGFKKLRELCKEINLPDLKIPSVIYNCHYTVDKEAEQQLSSIEKKEFIPVQVKGDGSCLYRALSFLCFGHEDRHLELRVRCIIEMATNSESYLDDESDSARIDSDSDSEDSDSEDFHEEFYADVISTCEQDHFTNYRHHIQALGVILQRKIKYVFPTKHESEEEKEVYIVNPQDLTGEAWEQVDLDKPLLTIMWLLDEKHFLPLIPNPEVLSLRWLMDEKYLLPLIPSQADLDEANIFLYAENPFPPLIPSAEPSMQNDSGLGDSINDETSTDQNLQPNHQSTQSEDNGGRDERLDGFSYSKQKQKELIAILSVKELEDLTGPHQVAQLKKLKDKPIKYVTVLIEAQFVIKWDTSDGSPKPFNFYDFCNDVKQRPGKEGKDKTKYLKYDPRRAHVFTELFRERQAVVGLKDSEPVKLCPDVYVKVKDHGWVRICFATKKCEKIEDLKFSWMHNLLLKFVTTEASEVTLQGEVTYSSVTKAIKKKTLYWAVLKDTDFRSGDHLHLHEIGETQVYVGKANGGIEKRWVKDSDNHSEKMKDCAEGIRMMKDCFDVSRLKGIQLVDARLLLAKIRPENSAVFLIDTFEKEEELKSAEGKHREGKNHREGKKNTKEKNIVPYDKINATWSPKKMEFGMNYS